MLNRFKCLVPLLCALVAAPVSAATVRVAVAANVQFAFDALRTEFRKQSGHEIEASVSSSGKLTTQIMHGAPFDVFMSADMEYPEKLHAAGFAAAAPRPYAYGALVLWTMKDLDLANWQSALSGPGVLKIALANPQTAPYGRETIRALEALRLHDKLKSRLVYGESIAQTNQYIHSRVADAGFTAKAVVLSPEMQRQGKWIDLPRDAYQPIAQGAVLLRDGAKNNAEASQAFYAFLFSDTARRIFARYGYLLP
jgi:molybdate transport system substrate-binding protein